MAKVTETVSSSDRRPLPALLAGPGSQTAILHCRGTLRTRGPGRTAEPSSPMVPRRDTEHSWAPLLSWHMTQASQSLQGQDPLEGPRRPSSLNVLGLHLSQEPPDPAD